MDDLFIKDFFKDFFPQFKEYKTKVWESNVPSLADELVSSSDANKFPYPVKITKFYSGDKKQHRLVFEVSLPGVNPAGVGVKLSRGAAGNHLIVSVQPLPDFSGSDNHAKESSECLFSTFSTKMPTGNKSDEIHFDLPDEVDAERLQESGVTLKNGLLTIEVYPKVLEPKPENIISAKIRY